MRISKVVDAIVAMKLAQAILLEKAVNSNIDFDTYIMPIITARVGLECELIGIMSELED